MTTSFPKLSYHAAVRAQQRGIRPIMVDFILRHADVDLQAGNGCRAYRISKRGAAELLRNGAKVADVDRASGIVVVLHEESGKVVTLMHDRNADGRRHRR